MRHPLLRVVIFSLQELKSRMIRLVLSEELKASWIF